MGCQQIPSFGFAKVWDWLGGDIILIRGSKFLVRVIFFGKKSTQIPLIADVKKGISRSEGNIKVEEI